MAEASSGNVTAAPSLPAPQPLPNSNRGGSNPRRGNRPPGRGRPQGSGSGAPPSVNPRITSEPSVTPANTGSRGGGLRRGRGSRGGGRHDQTHRAIEQHDGGEPSVTQSGLEPGTSNHRPPRRRPHGSRAAPSDDNILVPESSTQRQLPQNSRRKQFGSKLTASDIPVTSTTRTTKESVLPSTQDLDLTSRLVAAFSRGTSEEDLLDCPICFSSLTSGAPTWSCSPLTSSSSEDDPVHTDHGASSCCWTTFHLKCIKAWASKSVHETAEAYANRGLTGRPGEWRCPGCQTRRSIVPYEYRCFCGRVVDPRPGRLSTPHSCGESCQRSRGTCDHACPL